MPKKSKRARRERPSKIPRPPRARSALLVFLLASQPLVFSPWNTEYGYVKTVYTLVLGALLLLLWAGELGRGRGAKLALSWLFPILPALLAAALLSLTGPTPACVVLQSAAAILLFGLLYLFVLNTPERSHPWLLGGLLFAASLQALLGLLQYLGLVPGGPGGRGPSAMIATLGNQQFLAGFLSYLVFPGLLLLRARRAWVLAALVVGFTFATLLLTGQIGVRLGLGAAWAFVSFGMGFWRVPLPPWPKGATVGALFLAALAGTLGVPGLLAGGALGLGGGALYLLGRGLRRWPALWAGVAAAAAAAVILLLPLTTPLSAVRDLWARRSGAIRAWDWWVGYEMWRDHPAFGIGLGGYKIFFVPYKPQFLASPRGAGYTFPFPRADQAHNEYVQLAAELGTFGFLVLLGGLALLAYFGLGRISRQTDAQKRGELLLLGAGLIAFLVHAVPTFPFHLPASSLAFVVLLGLAFAPRYGPHGDLTLPLGRRTARALAGTLALLAGGVGFFAVRDIVADGYLLAAQAAYYAGRLDLAGRQITRAVDLDFCPRVSLYWYGLIQAARGNFEEARDAFQACRTRFVPETLYLNLAAVHLQLGEPGEARTLLTELLATVPPRDMAQDARYYLAVADLKEGDLLAAKTRLEEVVRTDRRHERAWILLGEIARRRYLWDEARAAFQEALRAIDGKLRRIEEQLSRPLPLKDYGELRAQRESLLTMRSHALQALAELP